ncbi:MAG: aminopeptidase [Deltaproteobacteria bacterium]|nr:aminopeptidase [Deltaproteobacteria bacterium]MBI3017308.1 aminopeptidase [Deltaproteobacteria bacterium]
MKASIFFLVLFLLGIALLLEGCSLPYLAHVSRGQIQIINRRQKIEEAIQKGKVSDAQKKKLELVLEVRTYAIEKLKLKASENYTKYVDLKRDSVAYNLVVCPKDSLNPYTWWFPFVGRVAYLGFFDKEYALKTKKEFEEDGYDTYLRGVSAYSTLGWFDDPVFSTMLSFRDETLANVIIHELTHGTIYRKGDTPFNEGVATFVGNKGALEFLKEKYGAHSQPYQSALEAQADDLLFSAFISEQRKKLDAYYGSSQSWVGDPSEEKVLKREGEFLKIKKNFQKLKLSFKTSSYLYFDRLPLNNAIFVAFGQYYEDLSLFEKVWEKHNYDLLKTIDFFKQRTSDDEWDWKDR